MGFGVEEKTRFCSITKDARIGVKVNGEMRLYDFVEGRLEGLAVREVLFGGEPAEMLSVLLRDEEGPLSVGTSLHGSAGRSIVLSLASEPRRGLVKIRPYKNKAGYTSVAVSLNERQLRWAEPLAELDAGLDIEPVDLHRREQIRLWLERIKASLAGEPWPVAKPVLVGASKPAAFEPESGEITLDDVPF